MGDTVDYYYGNLLPSTGFIWLFDIVKYYDGLLLRIPNKENPNVLEEVVKQEKMLDVFKEHLRWNYIMGLSNVGELQPGLRDRPCHRPHQRSRSPAGEKDSPNS